MRSISCAAPSSVTSSAWGRLRITAAMAMPWDAADAVVFDIGNVLVGYTPDASARRISSPSRPKSAARSEGRISIFIFLHYTIFQPA